MTDKFDKNEQFVDAAMSTVRVIASREMASAALVSFEHAAEEGRPLTQKQQIDVVANLMMAYGDLVLEASRSLRFEHVDLHRLVARSEGRSE